MYIRPINIKKNGKQHEYWALVESYRTDRGPRQRIVAYLGELDKKGRLGIKHAAQEGPRQYQKKLFDNEKPEWVEVDASRVRVENCREFGGPWLGMELISKLGLKDFFDEVMPSGAEYIPWSKMALVLVLSRLCNPSSELHIAEHSYKDSALPYLLGIPSEKVNDNRLYRALDALLPRKEDTEVFLKKRLGELFNLDYDIVLYDVTSTYFEGEAASNPLAQRGYSRDKRKDCKQVCIGLAVSKEGMPFGYEVFAGNRRDVTTLEEVVEKMQERYGKAKRIWVLDRGMVSEDNIEFLNETGAKYIVGTSKGMLKKFEQALLQDDWESVRKGLEVKKCQAPDGEETFILCRSSERREKEKGIHERFEKRIEKGLQKIHEGCSKRNYKRGVIERRIGRLFGQNTRSAGLFDVKVVRKSKAGVTIKWSKVEPWRDWARLSEGCYLLRSNITDWSAEDLWKAYIQLTDAEAAFRIHKSDLRIRPIWHQKEERVCAHIFVCFLAYVLWKTLAQMCKHSGLGDEPRRVFEELAKLRAVDVVMPTRKGIEIRKSCVTKPSKHQAILLQRLDLALPSHLKMHEM